MKDVNIMKKICVLIALIILFGFAVTPIYAIFFSDDFNDGNADGWWLGYSQHTPWVNGNWRVEDGKLAQDQGGDDFIALVNGIQISSQTVETQLNLKDPSGYAGITLWFKDDNNWVNIRLYPAAGDAGEIIVTERADGTYTSTEYPYLYGGYNTWFDLKVKANSVNGNLNIYVNSVYILTHTVTTTYRSGQSGVHNGNAGGYFDNFSLKSNSSADKSQCKDGSWKEFDNPTFKNQGACISYTESNENAGKRN